MILVRGQRLKIGITRLLSLSLCVMTVAACSKSGQFNTTSNSTNTVQSPVEPPGATPTTPTNPGTPPLPPVNTYKPSPLLWEVNGLQAQRWSLFVYSMFATSVKDVINAADDMVRFCPKFGSLNMDQKINTWGMLISAMAKYESNFDPTSRMKETTMGTDPVTGQPVYSEGLLQLSYQDITGWNFCRFDWNKDKYLAATDPRKTILDPFLNLDCGVKILAEQVTRQHKIVIDRGAYWAVIKENGKYQKINEIASLVQTLKFCK